ncbi:MAG TPA: hypothetical protein VGA04_23860 [Streptosporangiaceae bacterium]
MTRNRQRHGRLTVVSGAGLLLVTLTACGGNAGAAPAASSAPNMSQFITCLQGHGVSVASGSDVQAIRAALKSIVKTQRKSAVAACRQYSGGLIGAGKAGVGKG